MSKTTDLETEHFFALTPDKILDAVEKVGLRCTGRCLALNSMENRVYEVEVEVADDTLPARDPARFRIIKFYRPGRWSEKAILEEHSFLLDLASEDIPVVTPLKFDSGKTLELVPGIGIWCSVFKKIAGRTPQELNTEDLLRLGRLLARVHTVGASRESKHRLHLTPITYGRDNLKFLLDSGVIPEDVRTHYVTAVEKICAISESLFEGVRTQRIHGDCHMGNIISTDKELFLVDFDDMVIGPPVQDLWLVIPGRDDDAKEKLGVFLNGYEEMRHFDRETLNLIEPLRALRYIHFTAWIARRFADPAFQRVFTRFGTAEYWREQLYDLHEQYQIISEGSIKW